MPGANDNYVIIAVFKHRLLYNKQYSKGWRVAISSIIIDGYNLIGIYHKDLEKQRQRLIDTLIEYKRDRGHNIIVVFDAWKSGSGTESHSVTGGVEVIYSRFGEKADAVIKRVITSDRRQWIVVSTDRDIADHAWACGSIALSSEEFLDVIERSKKVTSDDFNFLEEEYELPRKGSPRKLSKKEKAKRRALNKL